ncbi:MAG: FAD-dependent oxidoreductase [Pseudanabaenaceae cyanobacterium bins.39]|nr:FAD-dependent oxidoreductase [Pseudanabaenaceae cyanobacterium bins.39]
MKVNIIGCGVIGAAIAYHISRVSRNDHRCFDTGAALDISVFEANPRPAMVATGASLGVLMGACSAKARGDLINLRLRSLGMYDRWIDDLQSQTGLSILYNRQGILNLYRSPVMSKLQSLIAIRKEQGFDLEWLEPSQMPDFLRDQTLGGLFSPCDRAVHPVQLVNALVTASAMNGVTFYWDQPVQNLRSLVGDADAITVVTAGMGARELLAPILPREILQPIGGQAVRVRLPNLGLQQVIHAEGDLAPDILPDLNIVPLGNDEYWLGATVEFEDRTLPRQENMELLRQQAIAWCPAFQDAEILETWAGHRPRPQGAKAPILGAVPDLPHILLAIGHYRNGVMMAPITAQIISDLILNGGSDLPWQGFALK